MCAALGAIHFQWCARNCNGVHAFATPLAFYCAGHSRKNKTGVCGESRFREDLPGGALLRLYRNEKIISGVCSPSQEICFSFVMRSMPLSYCTSCNTLQCGIVCCLTDLAKIESPPPPRD